MKFESNFQNPDNIQMENDCQMGTSMPMSYGMPVQNCIATPIYECPEEKVCHRYMCYEVPHIKPCNTRIINHHVYRHTFKTCPTCCEENVIENVYDPRC